ncbi:MAG: hypothetical protein CVT77_01845 [Alphaproteobacteria bacterium HGW-Alphaproteobacteria-16]|nr:MAG: hypothetical protein CVT77_01845 [Alphaproteobacteria bacterium HGW-Alphaproteobacteria-16]
MATQHATTTRGQTAQASSERPLRGIALFLADRPSSPAPAQPEDPSSKRPAQPEPPRFRIGDIIHFYLHLLGVVVSTQLIVWGLFFLLFLLLGDASIDGMMRQLVNLSTRYVAAGFERQMQFKWMFAAADLLLCFAVIVIRHERLLPPKRTRFSAND